MKKEAEACVGSQRQKKRKQLAYRAEICKSSALSKIGDSKVKQAARLRMLTQAEKT